METTDRWRYGLIAVGMGLVVILLCFGVAVWKYENAADAGAVLAAVTGTVGAIVGAYFGIQVGSAGKDKAEDNALGAQKALGREKDKAQALAGALPEGAAQAVLREFM